MENIRFATRLNSFASCAHSFWPELKGKPNTYQMIERAATVKGLTDVDLNYPQHIHNDVKELKSFIADKGLHVNGMAMRFNTIPEFQLGAFTHPEERVRREAVELTKRGIDCGREFGTRLMTIWLGQDGFDYCFQADYERMWNNMVECFREVGEYAPDCSISIEYKPNEPRAYSILPNATATLLAIHDIGLKNIGVTLDFCHVLFAGEIPAFAAALVSQRTKIMGLHLNDGWCKRDDGLMVGSVNLRATLELIYKLRKEHFDGAYYFDTFPDASGMDPVKEAEVNIQTVLRLIELADKLAAMPELDEAIARQDSPASQRIVNDLIFGK
ncbi:MAG: TIM barrel protein [Proteobacteria bacterium]|uniref:TIM barrel protein n=1 Tax=Candidatus Avisuccinivibrio stercorigallinarum TaxID=2840704 RepID=A0A9D9DDF1_9GAMM|nr:TIM barrel protein [Candidatus Avisuccinivibrio stercorigallinarum]